MRWEEKTLEVRFPRVSPKMNPGKLFVFLETVLMLDLEKDAFCIQQEYTRKVVSINFKSEEKCREVACLDNGSLELDNGDGAKVKVSLYHASCSNVLVRVLIYFNFSRSSPQLLQWMSRCSYRSRRDLSRRGSALTQCLPTH